MIIFSQSGRKRRGVVVEWKENMPHSPFPPFLYILYISFRVCLYLITTCLSSNRSVLNIIFFLMIGGGDGG